MSRSLFQLVQNVSSALTPLPSLSGTAKIPLAFHCRIPYRLQAYFRPPRFITMEEYKKEGIEETAKALKALREYCESPECNTWKTVSRLKSPKRYFCFQHFIFITIYSV